MKNDTILYIVRHGQTYFNRSKRVQGWADTPLTPNGAQDISALGRNLSLLPFAAAFSSDAGRARETASLILAERNQAELNLMIEPQIREWSFGSWEGELESKWWEALAAISPYETVAEFRQHRFTFNEIADAIKEVDEEGWSETYAQLETRTLAGFKQIAEQTFNNGGGNVLAVSHGLTISHFINLISPSTPLGDMANGGVTKVRYCDGKFELLEVNNLAYLEAGK